MLSIIFPQFRPEAFSQNCWKKSWLIGFAFVLADVQLSAWIFISIIQLLGHCIAMWFAMSRSLVKLAEIGTSWDLARQWTNSWIIQEKWKTVWIQISWLLHWFHNRIYPGVKWDQYMCSKILKLNNREIHIIKHASRLECVPENYFSYFLTKTYVVGTQKNRLNETVLLSTQNICLNWWVRK